MSETDFNRGSCQKCGGHIEFPIAGVGSTINCPHCGARTTLISDSSTSVPATAPKSKGALLIISGVLFLVLILGTLAFLRFYHKQQTAPAPPPIKPPIQVQTPKEPPSDIKSDFSIGKISLQKTEGSGLVYAVGVVKNDLDRQRFGVKIELNLIDEQGQNIGSASDYTSVIEAHKEWHFKALLAQPGASKAIVADIVEQQ